MDIRIRIVPNPLYGTPGSLVENAYKGEVIHTGTVTAADICEACKQENPQMTEPLASLATETIMDYGSDRVVTDVVRFNLGSAYFTMEPAVSGSVPTVDAALSDANERYIRVVNGPSLNARIAALRPVITGDDLGDVQFHSTETVRDDGEFKNTLFGDEEFVALGKRLGGADQRMELVAADGTTVSAATFLGGDALGQRFRYRLATPPAESGAYTLVLTSTGKDTPDASPKTVPVKVAYVAPEPLRISITDAKAIASGRVVRIKCENAEGVSGYHEDDVCFGFMADIIVNGASKGEFSFGGPKDGSLDGYVEIEDIPFSAGDTVKVTVHPDPEKTEYVQEGSSFTATAE